MVGLKNGGMISIGFDALVIIIKSYFFIYVLVNESICLYHNFRNNSN